MADSAQARIQFMQIVDALEQGQGATLPGDVLDRYVQQGWLERDAQGVRTTDEGRRQYEQARNERQATG